MVHAKVRVKASVTIDGKDIRLPAGTHYAGERIWLVQAAGLTGDFAHGHLDFDRLLKEHEMLPVDMSKVEATVRIESWVINHEDDEALLFDDAYANPVAEWYWLASARSWVLEVAPSA